MTKPTTALVVDDHPTNRRLAVALLKSIGWQTLDAESGEVALVLAAEHPFRLVLLDISMPGLSGEETCTLLRAMPQGAVMHIVAYTAHAFPEDLEHLLANGFDDILIKPISLRRLEELTAGLG